MFVVRESLERPLPRPRYQGMAKPVANCPVCRGAQWVHEDDPCKPWDASDHDAVGVPCRKCNQPEAQMKTARR